MEALKELLKRRLKGAQAAQIIVIGFALIILTGTLLLSLPAASATGESVGVFDALFTATSATCVTGLVVRDTGTEFSRMGQVIILMLIQVGGLGFMTIATLLFMLLGKRITLKERMLIQESMNESQLTGMVRLIRWVVLMTLMVEGAGAVLLSARFIPEYGWGDGVFYGVFHAVSAFCNAGFDLIGGYRSLTPYRDDFVVNFVIMALIVIGGLGYGVVLDAFKNRRFKKLALNARLVLMGTGALILVGALFFLAVEWTNPLTLGAPGMNPFTKAQAALFQSVTMRTAGFNTVELGDLRPASKMMSIILMFIGAAPASTGGGIKMTTFALTMLMVWSAVRGREDVVLFRRTMPRALVQRAISVFLIGLMLVVFDMMVLSIAESGHVDNFLDIMFECASAFGTVGVTTGITGDLTPVGRVIIILTMFAGRVGPLTLTIAIARKQLSAKAHIHYPDDRVLIG